MTQDQHKLEPCPFCGATANDGEGPVLRVGELGYHFVFCNGCGASGPENAFFQTDAIPAWNRRAHLQQRPLPVREGTAQPLSADYDPEKDPAFYTWTWDVWVSGGNWRAEYGWEKPPKDKKRIVRNVRALFTHPAPSLPVREEPTRVALRELLTAETAEYPPASAGMAAQTAWAERRAQARDQARAVLASSASVQKMGEGETGKDGVQEVPRADD